MNSEKKTFTAADAEAFFALTAKECKKLATGVAICILSPITFILLSGFAELTAYNVKENAAVAIGLSVLFVSVAVAVLLFIRFGMNTSAYSYLEKEPFEIEDGLKEDVSKRKYAFEPVFYRVLSVSVVLFILAPLPLILTSVLNAKDIVTVAMLCVLLAVVAVSVWMLICASQIRASYNVVLKEGAFRQEERKSQLVDDRISAVYWPVVTAIFLLWSFLSGNWGRTWIVWAIAGLLYVPVTVTVKVVLRLNNKNEEK